MPSPGKHIWLLCLPCLWFLHAFPGSYSSLWAYFAPLPDRSDQRTCSPAEFFGIVVSATSSLPSFSFNSPYLRGECADPVCGFALRVTEDHRLPGRQPSRRPVFVAPLGANISDGEELPEPCHTIAASGTVDGAADTRCSQLCNQWLDAGQRWRFVVHYLVPFCSVVAGWGRRGGGSVYVACGKSSVALLNLGNPVVTVSLAALYALPLLVVFIRELRDYRQARSGPEEERILSPSQEAWVPSPIACLPEGRFPGGALYFPYCVLSVSSDAQGERFCSILESVWVIPDVPSDLLTCVVYLRTGCAHRAFVVLASLFLVCDPLQLKGAKAMMSRWQEGFPSRLWWEYRGKQGACESGLSAALAFYSLASDMPESSSRALLRALTLAFSAGTSLLAVSSGAEAHALLHLADNANLELRDYYTVMRVRRHLGPLRLAAMLRVVSSAWAAAICKEIGRPELVAMNIMAVLLEALAREWDSHRRTVRLSLVAQACRYFCLAISLFAILSEALADWDGLCSGFRHSFGWHGLHAVLTSLAKASCAVLAGPLAFIATPAADVLSHRAFSYVRACVRSGSEFLGADSASMGTVRSGASSLERAFGGLGEGFERRDDSMTEASPFWRATSFTSTDSRFMI